MAIKIESIKRESDETMILSQVNGHHDTEKIEFEAQDGVISIRAFTTDEYGDEFGTIRFKLTESEFEDFLEKVNLFYDASIKSVMKKLEMEIRRFRKFTPLKLIANRTKEKGLNDGEGYNYFYVRRVIYTQEYFNEKIIDIALEVVRELRGKEKVSPLPKLKLDKSIAERIEEALVC